MMTDEQRKELDRRMREFTRKEFGADAERINRACNLSTEVGSVFWEVLRLPPDDAIITMQFLLRALISADDGRAGRQYDIANKIQDFQIAQEADIYRNLKGGV